MAASSFDIEGDAGSAFFSLLRSSLKSSLRSSLLNRLLESRKRLPSSLDLLSGRLTVTQPDDVASAVGAGGSGLRYELSNFVTGNSGFVLRFSALATGGSTGGGGAITGAIGVSTGGGSTTGVDTTGAEATIVGVSSSSSSSSSPDRTRSSSSRASSAVAKEWCGSSCRARPIHCRSRGGKGSSSPFEEIAQAPASTSATLDGYSSSCSSRPRIIDSATRPTCVTSARWSKRGSPVDGGSAIRSSFQYRSCEKCSCSSAAPSTY